MFQFPQAVGVGAGLLRLRSLRCGFLLEFCETLLVIKNPLGVLQLPLEAVLFCAISPVRIVHLQKVSEQAIGRSVPGRPIKRLHQLGVAVLMPTPKSCARETDSNGRR
jgi:hypothetical protein